MGSRGRIAERSEATFMRAGDRREPSEQRAGRNNRIATTDTAFSGQRRRERALSGAEKRRTGMKFSGQAAPFAMRYEGTATVARPGD
jgi:hypothetical protein